ncbi:MAG: BREX-6 system BrxE protein [Desulfobacteraceae bacterium]|nr:MAG: BREX-6 system BrxE protein [Desulfobacteraceae bacterium]
MISNAVIDNILALQITVAWAGEGLSEPKRLDWWKTDLVDAEGGGDFLKRLLPKTYPWASVEAVRKAAMSVDDQARQSMAKPDEIRTLFFWGFEIDEKIQERLDYLRHNLNPPSEVLPIPIDLYSKFNRSEFEETIRIPGNTIEYKIVPGGRELKGPIPASHELTARHLAAALLPLDTQYPVPFFRV